jgi:hypothetical protein
MARRRTLSVVSLLGAFAAGLVFFRRGLGRPRDRVDLYYADGSMLSLDGQQAEPLFEIARSAL